MKKEIKITYRLPIIMPIDTTAFFPHGLCPYQCEKDFGINQKIEIGFQNGQMYQITKDKEEKK